MTKGRIALTAKHARVVADGFATIKEAEAFLGLSRGMIYRLMESGSLQFAKFGKSRRLPWASLRSYAAQCLVDHCEQQVVQID